MRKTINTVQEKSTWSKYALIESRFKHLGRYLRTKRCRENGRLRRARYIYFSRCSRNYWLLFPSNIYMWSGKLRCSFCVYFVTRYRVIGSRLIAILASLQHCGKIRFQISINELQTLKGISNRVHLILLYVIIIRKSTFNKQFYFNNKNMLLKY